MMGILYIVQYTFEKKSIIHPEASICRALIVIDGVKLHYYRYNRINYYNQLAKDSDRINYVIGRAADVAPRIALPSQFRDNYYVK